MQKGGGCVSVCVCVYVYMYVCVCLQKAYSGRGKKHTSRRQVGDRANCVMCFWAHVVVAVLLSLVQTVPQRLDE